MANKAVFLDRDNTLIADPGYLSDPAAVKLLPGVESALRSLARAGYKLVVVTNQSAVARGLVTEATLEKIHAELRRQLAERQVHLDAIYYCPYHPEGTIEGYAIDSDLRKPKPGMLLQAAKELDLDLAGSWMVGDSPRDVGAGQRAGCRTVRVRLPAHAATADEEDEDAQADFTVRNLVDAAKIVLRETAEAAPPHPVAPPAPGESADSEEMSDGQVLREILGRLRVMAPAPDEDFSLPKVLAGVLMVVSGLAMLVAVWGLVTVNTGLATLSAAMSAALGVASLALYTMHRNR